MSWLRRLFLLWTLCSIALLSGNMGVHYSYIPKKVYAHQVFPLTVMMGTDENDTLQKLQFDRSSSQKPLFETPLIVKNGNETFYTFYFKASGKTVQIPRLFVQTGMSSYSLDPMRIPVAPLLALRPDKHFSGVLAADMRIKNYQVSNYDEKNHLVTLSLEAHEANLEDIKVAPVIESGIEEIKRDQAKVSGEFYVVLPKEQKHFVFTYYDTVKKRFVPLKIKVELPNASVTTQSDLNPKVDAFKRLKRYVLIALSLFFLLMFLWKRDLFYLLLGVISVITLMTFYIPHKKICVNQGAPLYILPTQTSTVGTHVPQRLTTMLLGKRGEFNKIELKKGVIGWIKDEEICKQ
ncbi:MAG: hypothetical protein DSZ10_01360 [Sulfurovum sp.]|nr:MAG: hypothetical protein DSZ10_01360 [Sulfurovum sp.]